MNEKEITTKGFKISQEDKIKINESIAKSPLSDTEWLKDVMVKAALYEKATTNEHMKPKIVEMSGLLRRIGTLFDGVLDQTLDDLSQQDSRITEAVQKKEEEIKKLESKLQKQEVTITNYKEKYTEQENVIGKLEKQVEEMGQNYSLQSDLVKEYRKQIDRLENEVIVFKNNQKQLVEVEGELEKVRKEYQNYREQIVEKTLKLQSDITIKDRELDNQQMQIERLKQTLEHQEQLFAQKNNILKLEYDKEINEAAKRFEIEIGEQINLNIRKTQIEVILNLKEQFSDLIDLKDVIPLITGLTTEELINIIPEKQRKLIDKYI